MSVSVSNLSKDQWVSVVKNAVIAGVVAFCTVVGASGNINQDVLSSAAVAAGVAAVKIVEKLLTPVV